MYTCFPVYPDKITEFTAGPLRPGGGITLLRWRISMTYPQFVIKHGFPVSAISATLVFFYHTGVFASSFNEAFLYFNKLVYKHFQTILKEEYIVLLIISDIQLFWEILYPRAHASSPALLKMAGNGIKMRDFPGTRDQTGN